MGIQYETESIFLQGVEGLAYKLTSQGNEPWTSCLWAKSTNHYITFTSHEHNTCGAASSGLKHASIFTYR